MTRNNALVLTLFAGLMGLTCVSSSFAEESRSGGQTWYRLIVQTMIRDNSGDVAFEPRPLRGDNDVWDMNAEDLLQAPDTMLSARKAVLKELGVALVNVLELPPCGGSGLPFDSLGIHRGCPRQQRTIFAIGVPRSGPASFPNIDPSRDKSAADSSLMSVRVLRERLLPTGKSLTAYDVELADDAGGWRIVRVVPLVARD